MTSRAKEKGKELENHVADQIVAKGIDPRARRDGASGAGNREKADVSTSMRILGRNIGIECKNYAQPHVIEWWKQARKLETLGMEPVLVYKTFGEPLESAKVIIYLDTFLEMAKLATGEKTVVEVTPEDSREKKYKIQRAIQAMKDLLKEYD